MANGTPKGIAPTPMMDRDYQAEDDHRTMSRAADIQNDPTRMAGVRKHHKKHMKKMALVQRQLTGMTR